MPAQDRAFGMVSTRHPNRPASVFPTSPRPARNHRALPSTTDGRVRRAMIADSPIQLELDDIQSGALQERPSPYFGTYLFVRIDTAASGRELLRRLLPVVDSSRSLDMPPSGAWVTLALTYHGLRALGVPIESLASFAPEFREGMAARASLLGDLGESSPEHWESPLGTPDVH